MYLQLYADGRQSLLNKEKSIREFYHSQVMSKDEKSPEKELGKNAEALSKLLASRKICERRGSVNPEVEGKWKLLKEAKMDSPRHLKQVKYEGHIKIPTVHNDYHARGTNMGFSRNATGGIFPK